MLLFLKIYLSHLIADFILQPNWMAKNKTRLGPLVSHSAIHAGVAALIINVDLNARVLIAIFFIGFSHAICDYLKAKVTKDQWLAFTVDQAIHLLIIILASIWLSAEGWKNLRPIVASIINSQKLFLYLATYVAVIFGGGFFVQKITQYFVNQVDKTLFQDKPGLRNAGKYIGWLERALITTFVVAAYPEGIGLLLAAKTIARYPEMKNDQAHHFAEYFLVGTFTSFSIALIAGFVLLKLKAKVAG